MNEQGFQKKYSGIICKTFTAVCTILLLAGVICMLTDKEQVMAQSVDPDEVERALNAYVPDPQYVDDPFIIAAVREAITGRKSNNGGIGACLVSTAKGEIVERAYNEQYVPHFRSDLHAEMVLLNRYEDRMRIIRSFEDAHKTASNPRDHMKGIVLYTSVEPCPMCMARIINSGIKNIYYAAADDSGGMGHRIESLPAFWQGMAQGVSVEPARCSPTLKELAQKLFQPMKLPGIH
jgi:cytosine deaminase